ncbi:MAG: PEP-CTERM sorting domain-containing protein [Burkholderiales bacterium]|jgi:hypothetical protein|nr:PEP-CTERM sorting domain-containing protein [Burkholderiales bacterium]
MKTFAATAGAVALVAASASAQAISTISFAGDGVYGDFSGTLTLTPVDADSITLKVVLNNLASTSAGGKLTGFVLNNPGNKITSISSYAAVGAPFTQLGLSNNGEKAEPFGYFDLGAALGGDWTGGGAPTNGIAVGASGTFTFGLEGADVDTLLAADFFAELSGPKVKKNGKPDADENDNKDYIAFAVRFKGFDNGKSDKVPAVVVPEPSTYAMLGIGLGLLGFAAKRRRKV